MAECNCSFGDTQYCPVHGLPFPEDRRAHISPIVNLSDDAQEDTLGEWLYKRMQCHMSYPHPEWRNISENDRYFWKHEADAVRRAVARNGFKNYDPEKA